MAAPIILVEGVSDVAALEVFGVTGIVAMGGATNVRRFAGELAGQRLIGLCDAGEERFFARALTEYFVCHADLEDEFIRALGTDATQRVLENEGDLTRFRTFQNQPAQRGRAVEAQLHRFLGTTGGRKEHYGRVFAEAVDAPPPPIAALIAAI